MTFLIQQTLIYAVPLMIVALAGVFAERSGIINLALEGIMIFGAFIGVLFVNLTQKAGVFAAAARHAHEAYGLTPVFLPINHLDDGQAAALVAEKLGDTPHVLLPGPMSSALVIGLMSRMQVVVSMRLHGLIFAAGQGVPLIGVSYDPKVTAFLRCVDAGCVPLEGLEESELCRLIDGAAARSGDAAALEENVRKLRAIEHRSMETAARLLGKEVQGC